MHASALTQLLTALEAGLIQLFLWDTLGVSPWGGLEVAQWMGLGGDVGVALSESPAARSEQAALSEPQLAGSPGRTLSGLGLRCQGDPGLGRQRTAATTP